MRSSAVGDEGRHYEMAVRRLGAGWPHLASVHRQAVFFFSVFEDVQAKRRIGHDETAEGHEGRH